MKLLSHLMHTLYHEGGRQFYQWNSDLRVEILADGKIGSIEMQGEPLNPKAQYRLPMQNYHYGIIAENFGLTHEDLADSGRVRTVSTSSQDNIIEYIKIIRSRTIPVTAASICILIWKAGRNFNWTNIFEKSTHPQSAWFSVSELVPGIKL